MIYYLKFYRWSVCWLKFNANLIKTEVGVNSGSNPWTSWLLPPSLLLLPVYMAQGRLFSLSFHPARSQLCVPVLCWSSKRCPQSICPAGVNHGGLAKAEPCPHPCPPSNTCFPTTCPALPASLSAGTSYLPQYSSPSFIAGVTFSN